MWCNKGFEWFCRLEISGVQNSKKGSSLHRLELLLNGLLQRFVHDQFMYNSIESYNTFYWSCLRRENTQWNQTFMLSAFYCGKWWLMRYHTKDYQLYKSYPKSVRTRCSESDTLKCRSLMACICASQRPSIPSFCHETLRGIMQQCWNGEPTVSTAHITTTIHYDVTLSWENTGL